MVVAPALLHVDAVFRMRCTPELISYYAGTYRFALLPGTQVGVPL